MAKHPDRHAGTQARHGRLRVTTAWGSLGKTLAITLVPLLAAALTVGGFAYWNLFGNVSTFELENNSTPAPNAPDSTTFEGGVNILIVGSDTREGQGEEFGEGTAAAEGTLNDVNMLFHLSEDHKHASLISIPRDTLIDTPECRSDDGEEISPRYNVMMNSILSNGGMNCIVSTVEEMSGIDIQFAAMITFRGVIEMSNAVGGVDVCVDQPIDDSYIGLELDEGNHTLQGADALKFLRTRHGVGDGSDLSRITNQQVFLSALFRKVKSNETLTDPTRLYAIARAATQNMTLSSNLNNLDTLTSLARALTSVPTDAMSFVRLPVASSSAQPGRVVPTDDAETMWELLRADTPLIQAPTATPAPTASGTADESPAVSPESTGMPTPSPTPTVHFTGQTANEQTCSNTDSLF